MLTLVGLMLICVDSCRTRVDSCRTRADSCWTRVGLVLICVDSCQARVGLVLIRVDSCWNSCIRIDLINSKHESSAHWYKSDFTSTNIIIDINQGQQKT